MNNYLAAFLIVLLLSSAWARADDNNAGLHFAVRRLDFRVADLERRLRGMADALTQLPPKEMVEE